MNQLNHLAIIMDGNGTWAKNQGKPRNYGHQKGTEKVKEIALYANSIGIKYLTLYSFSTENWKRPKAEVDYLMGIPNIFFKAYLNELMKHQIKITMIGSYENVPLSTVSILKDAIEKTKNNSGLNLCFAFNYGSRDEIIKSFNLYLKQGNTQELTEESFSKLLMTKDMPDVDLMIRTSAKQRLSNFMLWQLAYSELCFIDKCWPDFQTSDLDECIDIFKGVKRNFGGL